MIEIVGYLAAGGCIGIASVVTGLVIGGMARNRDRNG